MSKRHQRKMTSETVPHGEINRYQTVAQLTAQYNASPGTSVSVSQHTVQHLLLDMGLHSRRLIRVPLLTQILSSTTPTVSPEASRLNYG